MNRRAFVGSLLATLGSLTFANNDLLWLPTQSAVEVAKPEAILSLTHLTKAVVRGVSQHVSGHLVDGSKIGELGLTQQSSVLMYLPEEIGPHGLDRDRYVTPTVEALADAVKKHRSNVFGEIQFPIAPGIQLARVTNRASGVSIRAVMQYQMETDSHALRLDILHGKAA